jgi:hypothetical protein
VALQPLLKLAAGLGPRALTAVRTLGPLVATHPETVRQGRELVEHVAAAHRARSREERLRRTTAALGEQAQRLREAAQDPAEAERAAGWARSATSLQDALALVNLRRGSQKRADLARLESRVDALFAEVFTAAVHDEEPPQGAGPEGPPTP